MSISVTAIVIVAIVASAVIRLARIQAGTDGDGRRLGRHMASLGHTGPSQREIALQEEVEDLRERIKVLERIATDGRSSRELASQIDSLRDS